MDDKDKIIKQLQTDLARAHKEINRLKFEASRNDNLFEMYRNFYYEHQHGKGSLDYEHEDSGSAVPDRSAVRGRQRPNAH